MRKIAEVMCKIAEVMRKVAEVMRKIAEVMRKVAEVMWRLCIFSKVCLSKVYFCEMYPTCVSSIGSVSWISTIIGLAGSPVREDDTFAS